MLDKCEECGRAFNKRGDTTVCESCLDTLPVYSASIATDSRWRRIDTTFELTVVEIGNRLGRRTVEYSVPNDSVPRWLFVSTFLSHYKPVAEQRPAPVAATGADGLPIGSRWAAKGGPEVATIISSTHARLDGETTAIPYSTEYVRQCFTQLEDAPASAPVAAPIPPVDHWAIYVDQEKRIAGAMANHDRIAAESRRQEASIICGPPEPMSSGLGAMCRMVGSVNRRYR